MRNIVVFGLALLLAPVFASPALEAATAHVQAHAYDVESGQGPIDDQFGQTTASAFYSNPEGGNAEAFAMFTTNPRGGLSMKAYATGTAGEFVSNRGSASLEWADVIHTTGTPLDLLIAFEFQITGSMSGSALMEAGFSACVGSVCNTYSASGPVALYVFVPESPFLHWKPLPSQSLCTRVQLALQLLARITQRPIFRTR